MNNVKFDVVAETMPGPGPEARRTLPKAPWSPIRAAGFGKPQRTAAKEPALTVTMTGPWLMLRLEATGKVTVSRRQRPPGLHQDDPRRVAEPTSKSHSPAWTYFVYSH